MIIGREKISGVHCEANSWYYKGDKEKGIKGSQIDLLIVRKDQIINMCEMKYAGAEYEITKADNGKVRRFPFRELEKV